ncbi:MAG: hypothetical protein ACPGSN_02610 [Psychrobium sp.]
MLRITIIIIATYLAGCASTNQTNIKIENAYMKQPSKVLLTLLTVNGKIYKKPIDKAGSYLIQVERLKSNTDKTAEQSFHTMRVKLNENSTYKFNSKEENGYIYVWVEDVKTKKIMSTVSALSDFEVPSVILESSIETIAISGQRLSRLDKIGMSPCGFRNTVSSMNKGFEGSITDKKLPKRLNHSKC